MIIFSIFCEMVQLNLIHRSLHAFAPLSNNLNHDWRFLKKLHNVQLLNTFRPWQIVCKESRTQFPELVKAAY